MDDWLNNADDYLRGYVVTNKGNMLINNKKNTYFISHIILFNFLLK